VKSCNNKKYGIEMLDWLWELVVSFVYYVLALFGIKMGEKHVHFEDDSQEQQESTPDAKEEPSSEETA